MRALILLAGTALVSGCTTLQNTSTAEKIDFGCELAVLAAQTTGTVANVAQQHGADPAKAQKIARAAAEGEDVTNLICNVANVITAR